MAIDQKMPLMNLILAISFGKDFDFKLKKLLRYRDSEIRTLFGETMLIDYDQFFDYENMTLLLRATWHSMSIDISLP